MALVNLEKFLEKGRSRNVADMALFFALLISSLLWIRSFEASV
jgi:hypothetical protein